MLDTTKSPPIDAAAPLSRAWPINTFLDRDEWIRLLLAVDCKALSHGAKLVATRIALYHNIETGQCNPSMPMLGADTGTSERTARRMIRELEQAGWLRVDQSRGRHHNSFELRVPETLPTVDRVQDHQTLPTVDRVREGPTRSTRASNPVNSCMKTVPTRPPVGRQNSERYRTENRTAKDIDSPAIESRSSDRHGDIENNFETWYRQYPKHVARSAALKAYRTVITKQLATHEELLVGAMRYAAERTGQDPKFTKHAPTWLNADAGRTNSSCSPNAGQSHEPIP